MDYTHAALNISSGLIACSHGILAWLVWQRAKQHTVPSLRWFALFLGSCSVVNFAAISVPYSPGLEILMAAKVMAALASMGAVRSVAYLAFAPQHAAISSEQLKAILDDDGR